MQVDGMNKNRAATLCPELTAVLQAELAAGNVLVETPFCADWDGPMVYARLAHPLRTVNAQTAQPPLRYLLVNDPHYGWFDEVCCTLHGDELTAGEPRRGG